MKHIASPSRFKEIKGRLMFAYSFHRSRDRAESCLEDMFADGLICEAERPEIAANGNTGLWSIFVPA